MADGKAVRLVADYEDGWMLEAVSGEVVARDEVSQVGAAWDAQNVVHIEERRRLNSRSNDPAPARSR